MENIETTTQLVEPTDEKKTILGRHPFAGYLLLAYSITWISLFPLVLDSLGYLEVSIHWHFIGALGPTLAAVIMIYFTKGKTGMQSFKNACINWKIKINWIGIAFIAPVLFFSFALVLDYASSGTWYDFSAFIVDNQLTTLVDVLFWALPIIAYGVFEEIGWRGFALPHLQSRYSAIVASTILWLVHGMWHIPMFFYRFNFDFGMVVGFFIGMYFGTILLTFIFNSSKGSVLTTVVWHTTFNAVSVMGSYSIQAFTSMAIMIVAVLILIKYGRRDLTTGTKVEDLS
ncbi:MAG: CPBP family intramembrane glutamic endopeptidase [Candidatus Thorarchaeota archaeon]